jgi:hypothetical protein
VLSENRLTSAQFGGTADRDRLAYVSWRFHTEPWIRNKPMTDPIVNKLGIKYLKL